MFESPDKEDICVNTKCIGLFMDYYWILIILCIWSVSIGLALFTLSAWNPLHLHIGWGPLKQIFNQFIFYPLQAPPSLYANKMTK